MKKFTCILFLLVCAISFGQVSGIGPSPGCVCQVNTLPSSFQSDLTPPTPGKLYQNSRQTQIEIVNSPFLMDDYKEGKTTIHGIPGFSAKMRYNAAKDVIEFIDEDQTTRELLRRPYINAEFDGKKYFIIDYIKKGRERLGYFNPLTTGKAQLLLMPKKRLELSQYQFQERREAYYRDVSAYFIKLGEAPAVNITLNKATLIKILDPAYEKVLNFYISENNLKLKSEDDVIRLLKYYNTLVNTRQKIQENG